MLNNSPVFFSEDAHIYFAQDGHELIGVTSLMKKHGISADYSHISKDVLEAAAVRGKAVHKLLEEYDNGAKVEDTSNLKAYIEMCEQNNFEIIQSEYLISDNEIVASSIDKVLNDYSIADIKTTSQLHIDALRWQLSIYAYLFELQNPTIKVPHLYAWHIRDGKAKSVEIERIPDSYIVNLINYEKEHGNEPESHFVVPILPTESISILSNDEEIALYEAESMIVTFKQQIEQFEATKKALYEKLYTEMQNHRITKFSCNKFDITLVEPYSKQTIDGKLLKDKYPDIAAECTKVSTVKGSIKIKIKNNE